MSIPGSNQSPLDREAAATIRESEPERAFANEIRWLKLPAPVREFVFMKGRRFRFDFAWPELMVAVEVEGGTFSRGRHSRGKGFAADCEKYNLAVIQGWRVLRVTPEQITSGEAVHWLEQVLLPF
jgi:very-short-patch-repair endonuclease